ncbi:MAG: cellulose biosynthesis protein BcsS [Novosphingobium sp.]
MTLRTLCLAASLCVVLSLTSAPAAAQDTGVVYAGGSTGDGTNGYAGGVVALPGGQLGKGLAVRASVSGGQYRYDTNGRRISADYIGGEAAMVYQMSGTWGWVNLSAGPRVTDTRLKPVDPGNRTRGTRFDLALQTDGTVGNAWRATWFASLGVHDRAYITQVRFNRLIDGETDTRLGIEGGVQGDRNYTRPSAGLFASTRLGNKWQGLLSGGISKQKDRSARPYVSLGVSRVF